MGQQSPKTPMTPTENAPLPVGQCRIPDVGPTPPRWGAEWGGRGSPEGCRGDPETVMAGDKTTEREGEQALVANLRDLIDEAGQGEAARQLGVDRKTLWRALDAGRLTPRVREALERRGANPEGARRRSRLDALERRTELIDKDVEALAEAVEALREEFGRLADLQAEALRAWERRLSAVESRQAAGTAAEPPGAGHDHGGGMRASARHAVEGLTRPAIGREPGAGPHRAHPEVVTLRAEEAEELDYAEAMPLVAEWRGQRIAHLDEGARRVERARALVHMLELEIVLIRDHALTLPPSAYPWDESRRRDELRRVKFVLVSARWELAHALFWRWVRLALTLGRWRR